MPQTVLADSDYARQIALENESVRKGIERYRALAEEATTRGQAASLKPAERLMLFWLTPLIKEVRREQADIRAGRPGVGRAVYGLYALTVPADKLALITVQNALNLTLSEPTHACKVVRLALAIGRDAMAESMLSQLKTQEHREKYLALMRRRKITPKLINWHARKTLGDEHLWRRNVQARLGVALMWLMLGVCGLSGEGEKFIPAFHFRRTRSGIKTTAYINLDGQASDIIDDGHEIRQFLRPRYLPMVAPPGRWEKVRSGGYYTLKNPLVLRPSAAHRSVLAEADLSDVMDALNALSMTPWRINRAVLDVQRRVWESGGEPKLGIPRKEPLPLPAKIDFTDPEQKREWKVLASEVHRKNHGEQADRVTWAVYRLPQAERFAAEPKLWFPHQLDFRGRAYPIPGHLNHQGDDTCRGLLEFAEGVPLTPVGIEQLKIHAANCYGLDKAPFAERIAWADASRDMIDAIAADPLGRPEWRAADEPWQFLAACFALQTKLGKPSYLPCQADGTCNALQHYAALTRDETGAAVASLIPTPAPTDIYTLVARSVAELVTAHAAGGGDELAEIAAAVQGEIDRRLVKQPVMTTFYGVTRHGAAEQLLARLREKGWPESTRQECQRIYRASAYLSRTVMEAMGAVCPAAVALMRWLGDCARRIANTGVPVAWTTPLGLPVVQPYERTANAAIRTVAMDLAVPRPGGFPPHVARQSRAFPPNLIHSLDGTHMLLTAQRMHDQGLAFAAVHDSYWTHASNMPVLHHDLRAAFIQMHTEPIVWQLYEAFRAAHPTASIKVPPTPGKLDLSLVSQSPYLFH